MFFVLCVRHSIQSMQQFFIHLILGIIVLISCKEPPCSKDEDCSYGYPEDFNGKCRAKCVDKRCYRFFEQICNAEMIPQAEYFMTDDKTCSSSDDCKCSKEIKGDCYPMCVKDQCNFKIIPGKKNIMTILQNFAKFSTICEQAELCMYPNSTFNLDPDPFPVKSFMLIMIRL